jgi:tRNA pseudouridine55 synthase
VGEPQISSEHRISSENHNGFLNLNKPAGFTSHDCIAKLRRLLQMKRIGHAGTLDPMATGVLPIALGSATRLLQYLPGDKAYIATLQFGCTTTTDDITGEVISQPGAPQLQEPEVLAVLPQFCGRLQQLPPNYSAVQVGGKRLYDLARQGKPIQVEPRQVEVYEIQPLGWQAGELPQLSIAIRCGSGTYIRSIARDWGAALGVGGTLASLVRTASSGFDQSGSLTLAELAVALESGTFTPLTPLPALLHLPALTLEPELSRRWCLGQKLPRELVPEVTGTEEIVRVMNEQGELLGISAVTEALLLPKVVLN